jgi:hypothetical protein
MIQRSLLMGLSLAAGFLVSDGIEQIDLSSEGSASWRPALRDVTIRASAHKRRPADSASASRQREVEVKTADAPVLLAQKYTDGQATVDRAVAERVGPMPSLQPEAPADAPAAGPAVAAAEAAGEPAAPSLAPAAETPHEPVPQTVFTDYKAAMQEAVDDRKMLFVYFHEKRANAAQRAFEKLTLGDREIQEKLKRYVLLRLPRDASITHQGERIRLLQHGAFAEMLGRQGVAIIDLAHETADYYGHVVSTFPFTPGKYYRKEAMSIILDLPPGTLTQRTMIYAVRIHPEAPASTQGIFHTALADEAKEHANYQAAILVQGHHSWESRFHRINAKLPGDVVAQEVVAESWPNEGLVEAAVDCVHSWRQSPGHWGAVRRRHPLFGYDIKRGRNGIWYATGIFGLRHR